VWHDPTRARRAGDTRFVRGAAAALHDAYLAAQAACGGHARYTWEDHAIELALLDDDSRALEIEGRSLGLAATLAFIACWVEHPLRTGMAASARVVGLRGLAAIDAAMLKRDALANQLGNGFVLMVHHDDVHALAGDSRILPVTTIADALAASGLPAPLPRPAPAAGSVSQRKTELAALVERVNSQDLGPFAGLGVEPWYLLAERIAWICDSLVQEPDTELPRARASAALAFVHAGDPDAARRQLELTECPADSVAISLLRSVVTLSSAIDAEEFRDPATRDWSAVEALSTRIDTLLPDLPARERRWLLGLALGTQGRALLHARRPDAAVAKLSAAWQHHRDELQREAFRSSVALAMALRELGRASDALGVLDEGRSHYAACGAFSRDYVASTEMFWRYERGRVLLALGDPHGARAEFTSAHDESRARGFWPRLGILRVLAWATAECGDDAEHAWCIAECEALVSQLPTAARGFGLRMLAEAREDRSTSREVY
jgi:hypothetical protein